MLLENIVLMARQSQKDIALPHGTAFKASLAFSLENTDGKPWPAEIEYQFVLHPLDDDGNSSPSPLFTGTMRYAVQFDPVAPDGGEEAVREYMKQAIVLAWPYARVDFVEMLRGYDIAGNLVPSTPPESFGDEISVSPVMKQE